MAIQQLVPDIGYAEAPYDLHCPSVQKYVKKRICKDCDVYFPSMAAVDRHRKGRGCPFLKRAEEYNGHIDAIDDDNENNEMTIEMVEKATVINILEMLTQMSFIDNDGDAVEDDEV